MCSVYVQFASVVYTVHVSMQCAGNKCSEHISCVVCMFMTKYVCSMLCSVCMFSVCNVAMQCVV